MFQKFRVVQLSSRSVQTRCLKISVYKKLRCLGLFKQKKTHFFSSCLLSCHLILSSIITKKRKRNSCVLLLLHIKSSSIKIFTIYSQSLSLHRCIAPCRQNYLKGILFFLRLGNKVKVYQHRRTEVVPLYLNTCWFFVFVGSSVSKTHQSLACRLVLLLPSDFSSLLQQEPRTVALEGKCVISVLNFLFAF